MTTKRTKSNSAVTPRPKGKAAAVASPAPAAAARARKAPRSEGARASAAKPSRARSAPGRPGAAAPRQATRPAPAKAASRPAAQTVKAVAPALALTDEERIEDAKYQPRAPRPRVFEEERFVFPESYGQTRIRLHVKDPEWIFVNWDVDAKTLQALRREVGERVAALTRLTLRVSDAENGGGQTILLPPGARTWYVRTDAGGSRAYRAELGVTLPSGDFRALATSNTIVPPRVGPSPEPVKVRRRFVRRPETEAARSSESLPAPVAPAEASTSPWQPTPSRSDAGHEIGGAASQADEAGEKTRRAAGRPGRSRGGASELLAGRERGGASDVHRR